MNNWNSWGHLNSVTKAKDSGRVLIVEGDIEKMVAHLASECDESYNKAGSDLEG